MKLMKSYVNFCYSVNNIMSLASYHGVKAMYVGNVFSCSSLRISECVYIENGEAALGVTPMCNLSLSIFSMKLLAWVLFTTLLYRQLIIQWNVAGSVSARAGVN